LNKIDYWESRFWWFSAFLFSFRIFLSTYLDLSPDEAYYWEFSRRLDFSYYDHPPMVGYSIALFRFFLGDIPLSIRLPSILFSFLASFFIFRAAKDFFKDTQAGFWAVIFMNLTPAGTAVGFITTPDSPLLFAWAGGIYSFLKALESPKFSWWLITGFFLGVGALAKYNMIFFVPGIAITILAFNSNRKLVFTGRYWAMVILAALCTLPIIYWNINNDWISFRFQFSHGLSSSKRSFIKNLGDYLGGQFATIGLTLFPLLWYLVIKNIKESWQENNQNIFFLAWLAFPTMVFFAFTGLRSKVEANWPQMAYISAMLLVGFYISKNNTRQRLKWFLGPTLIVTILAVLQALTLFIPTNSVNDISKRLHGWSEMGQIIQKIDKETGHEAIFIVQGTTLSSLVAFYGNLPVNRITDIYCSGNYRIWWQNKIIPSTAKVVFVDDDNYSELINFKHYAKKIISDTYAIKVFNKSIRKININIFDDLSSDIALKPYK